MAEERNNLEIWNALEKTDRRFTKPCKRPGGFNATAVDPVYNMKRVTDVIGPIGYAWGWHILSERLDTFGTGEDAVTIHNLSLRVWFRQDDGSVREIDEVGLTTVAQYRRAQNANEKRRFDVDEEYGKKSLTDALSKAMMRLGASSDIWMGRFDGNKYVQPEDWPSISSINGDGKDQSGSRQVRQAKPQPPEVEVEIAERALGAKVTHLPRPSEDTDPLRLMSVAAEDVADLLIEEIGKRPWHEVVAAVKLYDGRLTLTDAEQASVKQAIAKRREEHRLANMAAAG